MQQRTETGVGGPSASLLGSIFKTVGGPALALVVAFGSAQALGFGIKSSLEETCATDAQIIFREQGYHSKRADIASMRYNNCIANGGP